MFRRIRHGAARRRVIPGAESPPATPARHALRLVCEDLSLGAPRPEDEDEASAILSDTLIQAPAGRLTEETLAAVDAWLAPRAAPGRQPAELRDATGRVATNCPQPDRRCRGHDADRPWGTR